MVYCSDVKYFHHLCSSIISLVESSKSSLKIYILSKDISQHHIDIFGLESICRDHELVLIRADLGFSDLKTGLHFSEAIYLRLCIPLVISEVKALYLDSDTIVLDDLSDLYNADLGDFALAAALDDGFYGNELLDLHCDEYFNSGVLLINLDYWREFNVGERCLDFAKNNPEKINWPDQDALNYILKGLWFEIPISYNFQDASFEKRCPSSNYLPKIIHFTGENKPWSKKCTHAYRDKYLHFRGKVAPSASKFSMLIRHHRIYFRYLLDFFYLKRNGMLYKKM